MSEARSTRVAVIGAGQLATAVVSRLQVGRGLAIASATTQNAIPASMLRDMRLLVLCMDSANASIAAFVSGGRNARIPTIAAWISTREIVVATDLDGRDNRTWPPLGCQECARLHGSPEEDGPADRILVPKTQCTHASADLHIAAQITVLAACNALDVLRVRRPYDTRATAIDLVHRSVIAEPVRPHHACSVCFPVASGARDNLRHAVLRLRERIFESPANVVDNATLSERLRMLTGRRFACFDPPQAAPPRDRHRVWRFFRARGVDPKDNALANAASTAVHRRRDRDDTSGDTHVGTGFDLDHSATADAIALAEGLERLFALSFRPKERIVAARYSDVAGNALDPRLFPLFDDSQYAAPDFPLSRFDPDALTDWVWGLDVLKGRPLLVAADLVFGTRAPGRIYQANSNGAACHHSLVQAVLNGIFETVERDALMVAWLNRLSLPRVAIRDGDPDPWCVRRTLAQLDFDVEHVDLTTDLGIPVLLAVLRDRCNPDFFMLDMVASTDCDAQLRKLYRELAQFVRPYLADRYALSNACTNDDDQDRIATFPDHVAYYQSAKRNHEANFLTANPVENPFGFGAYLDAASDRRMLLRTLVARLDERGHSTIVVDCTPPLVRDAGMNAVKVLVPGLQPLNCEHRLRTLGGERVVSVAQRLGYAPRRRTINELNPWPHPFW